jgi:hypothetical protein
VFRDPFTIKLYVDKERCYEQKIDKKIPFAADNNVYLFPGESFGLKLGIVNGEITTVSYQKEKAGADIELEFSQKIEENGDAMMMLVLKSKIKQTLYLDALMIVPEKKGNYKTSILPLEPGLMNFESWPHPIVQLVLINLRLKDGTENKPPEPAALPQKEKEPASKPDAGLPQPNPSSTAGLDELVSYFARGSAF